MFTQALKQALIVLNPERIQPYPQNLHTFYVHISIDVLILGTVRDI